MESEVKAMTAFIGLQSRCNVKFLFADERSFVMLIALALLVLAFAPRVHAQGKVVGMRGDWIANGEKIEASGKSLAAGSKIQRQSSSPQDYIVIADASSGKTLASRRCSVVVDCNQPFILPQSSRSTVFSIILDAATRLLWGERGKYALVRSRSEDVALLDAVVPLKEGKVDLSPVFKKAKKGLYNLQYRSVSRGGETAAGKSPWRIAYDWTPGKPASVSIPNLKPGLYELDLLEKAGEDFEPTGTGAWILVSQPAGYKKDAASFEEATTLTAQWSGEVAPNDSRSFLRAYLDHLNLQKSGKQKSTKKQVKIKRAEKEKK